MSKRLLIFGILLLMLGSFLVGTLISSRVTARKTAANGRKILHYVDPMHPSYTSDKPGIAPDCGMSLEPVYAAGAGTATDKNIAAFPPGTVQLSADRQQLIGVRTATAEVSASQQTLRLTGRVVADETRVYVINATIDGWITKVTAVTTGSIVREEQVLASFYSPEFLSASSALLFALGSMDRVQAVGGGSPQSQVQKDQMTQFNVNLQQYKDSLRNLGMGRRQIEEMIHSRKYTENIDITSPGYGIILARNVSDGQRFAKGEQFFRIGDLSKVWIVVDTYGADVDHFRPGMAVKVTMPNRGRTFHARVSSVLPQFDPVSRTLKVRLEADNPGFILRPDMFVDIELPIKLPAMLSLPSEAVLDSGLKKTVFIERAHGSFEPREVETGRNLGNMVEIVAGLKAGEKVVISGTFLLDSESRMKNAAAGISSTAQQDPVCGMYLDEGRARAAGHIIEAGGRTNFFCSDDCKQKFIKNPAAKLQHSAPGAPPAHRSSAEGQWQAPGDSLPAKPDTSKKTTAKPVIDSHAGHEMPPAAPMTHDTGKKHD